MTIATEPPLSSFLPPPPARPGRFLVVDDEAPLLAALVDMLTKAGYEAEGISSSPAALNALREREFDVVLTDLMMPQMDGIELLRAGLDVDPQLVGVLMTGQGTVQTAVEAIKSGAFDYVLKPFKREAILPILARALKVRQLRLERVQLYETASIYELSQALTHTLEADTVLNKTADVALHQMRADEISILLPAREGPDLVVAAVRGANRAGLLGTRAPRAGSIAGWVAEQREALVLHGRVDDPRFAPLYPRVDIVSALSVPMLSAGHLVGVLNVNRLRSYRPFTPGQAKALSILANTAAAALENARLYAQVQQSEKRFRALIENAPDAIAVLTSEGKLTYLSPATQRILGYSPDEMPGGDPAELTHPDDLPSFLTHLNDLIQTPGQVWTTQYRFRHKDGSWRWVESTLSNLLAEPSVGAIVFNYRDITERRQRERELEAIAAVSAALRTAPTRAEMLPIILDQVTTLLNADAAVLEIRDPLSGEMVVELGTGDWAKLTNLHIPAGEGITAQVLATGRPYVSADAQSDPRYLRVALTSKTPAVAGVPLIAQQQAIGALWMGRLTPISDGEVRLLAASADIAASAIQRSTLHEATERNLQRLAALRAIDQAITGSLDLPVTLSLLLKHVIAQLHVDAAAVLLLDPHTQTLEYAAGRGFRTGAIEHSRLRLDQGYAGRAAFDRRAIHVTELTADDPDFSRAPLLAGEEFRSYYVVPLIAKGMAEGVLEIFHRSRLTPDTDWIDFLEALAGQAAIAIDNADLFTRLQHSNRQLTIAYDATIEGWSRALDLRDKETEGHTQRVTEMTLKIAQAVGIAEGELVHIRRGALLHDIGKLGVPDHILLAPRSLTDEEWAIMRKHPVYAYEMLSPIAYLHPALDIPYCHHEKWDGTGYPRGLKGEQIPLAARLFAVVDVWDALRSDRPYRAGWSEERVIGHIRSLSGTHFEPRAVEVFLSVIEEP